MQNFCRLIAVSVLSSLTALTAATPQEAYGEMERGNYAAAAEKWQQILSVESEFVTALNNLAYCKMQVGDFSAAADLYQKADAISPNLDSKAGAQWAYLALERYGESRQWGLAALKLDATNYWVNYRLALALEAADENDAAEKKYGDIIELHGARSLTLAPRAQLIPYYQSIAYSGSTLKANGFDAGMFALWNFDSGITTGGGYAMNRVMNPKTTDYYSTHEIRLLTGFLFNDLSSLTINSHVLSSNSTFLGNGLTLSAAYRPATSGLSLTGDAIIFGQHAGGALSPAYVLQLSRGWQATLGAQVQVISFAQLTKIYGAGQASLSYCTGIFCASAGGLYGSLFTPVLDYGNTFAYNPDEMKLMAFARLTVRPWDALQVSVAYTSAQWQAINGENPVSSIFTIALTGSLR